MNHTMRHMIAISMLLLFMLLLYGPSCFLISSLSGSINGTSLPTSLQYIEDEAFAETGLSSILFSENLLYIGSRAFSAYSLKDAYVPERTEYIGENAFPAETVIHGVENSYVQIWAQKNGLTFVNDYIFCSNAKPIKTSLEHAILIFFFVIPLDSVKNTHKRRSTQKYVRSLRPQDRTELYPINYRFP